MMEDAIREFPGQFSFNPKIKNAERFARRNKFIVSGMGGSSLGAWLLKCAHPNIDLLLHRDYDLPRVPDYFLQESLLILSSYSGNTEEVLDTAAAGARRELAMAVVTDGGELMQFAHENNIPYIDLPHLSVEPRMALGPSMLSLARLMHNEELEREVRSAGGHIDPTSQKDRALMLAGKLKNLQPVVYSSTANLAIAYNWKITFNETAKIPASYNVFPELCHNELSGFDVVEQTRELSKKSCVLMLTDSQDHPRIQKRMRTMKELLEKKSIRVEIVPLEGSTPFGKIFNAILLAEWIALTLAHHYQVPDAQTPLITEFKQRMSE